MAAPLRLCEQWAFLFRRRFSPRRKDAKVAKEKRPLLWRLLILKNHKFVGQIVLWNCCNLSCDDEPARDYARRFGVGASREAGLFASDADREFTRLDDALALVVNDRHPLGAERERDGLLFPRLKKDSLDPGQRSDRRRNRSGHVSHIQLNDFIAGAVAAVAHVYADLDALACLH